MNKEDKLSIVIDYLKYQLAFEMLANDYAQRFIEKEDLFMEVGHKESYWAKEVRESFLSKATDKMIEIVDKIYKEKSDE